MTSAPLPVLLRPSPFKLETRQHVAVEGQSIADILRDFPGMVPEVLSHGVVHLGPADLPVDQCWEIPREYWHKVKPRAGSRHVIRVSIRPGNTPRGGGGKNPLAMIAAIALVVVATAITGGAAAGFLGTSLFAAGSTSAALLAAGVSIVGALALNALAPPPTASQGTQESKDKKATLGSASIQGNVLEAFSPIPFVIGTHRVSPPHLITPWSESINDDQYVYAIVGLNGAHDFNDIRINGTPIDDLDGVEYEVRDVINDDTDLTLITSQVFENQVGSEISGHKVQDDATNLLQDTTAPANSYPSWVGARSRTDPDEIWLTFLWTTLLMQDTSTTVEGGVPIRMRIRRAGDVAWINLPEFHAQRERLEPFRGMIKLRFAEVPTSFVRIDQDTTRPPWRWVLYAQNSTNSESFDTDAYFVPASGNNANAVTGEDGVAVVYLDPATFPVGTYDVQVMRGYGYKAQDFTSSTYRLSSNIPYFFTHTAASSPPSLRQEQSKVPTKITWASMSSVWSEYPLGEKGLALLAVKARNTSVSALTSLVSGYANTWDGTDWDTFEPTSNPAAWTRAIMLGQQSIRAPYIEAQLDDDTLTDWYDFNGVPTDIALFDGVDDYLVRGAGLTGAADSKLLTFSGFIYLDGDASTTPVIIGAVSALAGTTQRVRVEVTTANCVRFVGLNAAASVILDVASSALDTGRWHHVMASFDLSSTSLRHLYVDGVSDLATITTYTNDTIDFTQPDWAVGSVANGSANRLSGALAELWFGPGAYLDLSLAANRRAFLNVWGRPARLGATGSAPTGSAPLVYLAGEISAWSVNKGTGGNFTSSGAPVGDSQAVTVDYPILECNAYVDGVQSTGDVLRQVAGTGRAALRASDKVGVVIERDRTAEDPIQLFSQRNTRGLTIRRAFPRVPDGLRVRFNDESNDYSPKELFVYRRLLDGDASNLEAITYVGVTNEAQALARAHLDLAQLTRRSALYNLETDIENIYCTKGCLVALAHDTVRRHYDAARVATVIDNGTNVTGITLDSDLRLTLSAQATDFEDDALASPPAGWASQWDANVTALVTAQASLPEGKGPLLDKTTAVGDSFFAWTDADAETQADCEILALIRPNVDSGTTDNAIGVILRGSGTNVTKTGYRAVLNSNSAGSRDRIEISKWVNGAFTFLANATFAWATGTNYWLRFRARGTTLKVKVWADGGAEPGSWNVTTTDSSVAGPGKSGAYVYHTSSTFYVGSFAVAPLSGVVIQLRDGTTRTEEVNETIDCGLTTALTFVTPFAIPAGGALDVDCLVASGPFQSVEKRMLVLGVQPQSEFTASLTLVDEAPPVQWIAPSGDRWVTTSGGKWFAPF